MKKFLHHLFKHGQQYYLKENIVFRKKKQNNKFLIFIKILILFCFFLSDEVINFLQKDYEYLQIFLSTNIIQEQIKVFFFQNKL